MQMRSCFGQAHRAADEIAVVEDVVMRQRHALGRARGAAGELDVDGIVELQRLGRVPQAARGAARRPCRATSSNAMVPGHAGPPIWITARSCGSRAACNSPGVRCREFRQQRVQHLHVVGGLERGRGDDRGASDLGQREFEFAEAIGGIDGDEDRARLSRRRIASASIPAGSATTPRSARRAPGRARESPPPAHRRARQIPSRSSARHGSAKPAPRDRPSAAPR